MIVFYHVKDANDGAVFKTAFESLQKASYKMAEQMYKQAPPSEGGSAGTGGAPPAGASEPNKDVIDAEFEEQR